MILRRLGFLVLILLLIIAGVAFFFRENIKGVLPLVRSAPEITVDSEPPLSLPEGFKVEVYADGIPGARDITRDPLGVVVVSLTSEGKVVALPDVSSGGRTDRVETILEGHKNPHGIVFRCGAIPQVEGVNTPCLLYVADEDAVYSYAYDSITRKATDQKKLVSLPANGGHFTRSLLLAPDDTHLLVSIGSSCNVCDEENRAAIYSLDLATNAFEPYATGLRNTVFMAIHPVTGEIWGTDMGRDLLGDGLPPDEINILEKDAWYGWPWFYGKSVFDEKFKPGVMPSFAKEAVPSHLDIPAHSAPLGLAFVPEEGWPHDYWHDLLVAYHGSWNRSEPTGYKVVRIELDPKGLPTGKVSDFITGFASNGKVLGRPVDIMIEPGGVVYVSDDRAGVIYKITHTEV